MSIDSDSILKSIYEGQLKMQGDVSAARQEVKDVGRRVGKLEDKVDELRNTVSEYEGADESKKFLFSNIAPYLSLVIAAAATIIAIII